MGVSDIRFFGTGRSMNPFTNANVNREPSRKGIEFSGAKSPSELNDKIRTVLQPRISELGDAAVKVTRQMRSGNVNVTA